MRSITYWAMMLLVICLSGCGSDHAASCAERTEEMKDVEISNANAAVDLTERQLQILRDCGLGDGQIREIQEKGLSASQKSFVETAEIILTKLAEKYGIVFRIMGGSIPDLLSSDYTFTVCAAEGEYALIPFEVTYKANAEGKGICLEGYFAVVKNQEMQEYLQSIADEEGIEIRVVTHVTGQVSDTYTKDCGLEDMKGVDTGIKVEVYGLVSADIDEADFMAMCEKLAIRYNELGYRMGYDIYRLLDSEQIAKIDSYEELYRIYPQGMRKDTVYDIRYHKYITGEKE